MLDTSSITREIGDFYDRYVGSYNNGDLDRYCDCFGVPLSVVADAQSKVFTSAAEVRESAEAQQRSFASSRWSHSVVLAKRVWLVNPELAVIVADLQRVDLSGEVYQTGRCVYNVVRQNGGWRIVTVAQSVGGLPSSDGLLDPPAAG